VIADLSSNTLVPMLGNGNGTFKPPVRYLAGTQPGSLGIIPLADGNTALLTVDDVTGDVVVAFAFADGTLTTPQVSLVGKNPTAIAAGDLNGDGKPDLATANYLSNTVSVLLNKGDGSFGVRTDYGTGRSPRFAAIYDLNGDGKVDIAAGNSFAGTNNVSVMLGNGDGTFRGQTSYATASFPAAILVADFDGDGNLDIATASAAGGGRQSTSTGADFLREAIRALSQLLLCGAGTAAAQETSSRSSGALRFARSCAASRQQRESRGVGSSGGRSASAKS